MPTRALDWSKSALQAAYFAASDAVRHGTSRELSVFAMADIYVAVGSNAGTEAMTRLVGAGNENLQAQGGVLLLQNWGRNDLWDARREKVVDNPVASIDAGIDTRLLRLDLATTHTVDLLQHLVERGIDGSTSFPGMHGLVRLASDLTFGITPR